MPQLALYKRRWRVASGEFSRCSGPRSHEMEMPRGCCKRTRPFLHATPSIHTLHFFPYILLTCSPFFFSTPPVSCPPLHTDTMPLLAGFLALFHIAFLVPILIVTTTTERQEYEVRILFFTPPSHPLTPSQYHYTPCKHTNNTTVQPKTQSSNSPVRHPSPLLLQRPQ